MQIEEDGHVKKETQKGVILPQTKEHLKLLEACLLYTSDAADE